MVSLRRHYAAVVVPLRRRYGVVRDMAIVWILLDPQKNGLSISVQPAIFENSCYC
jgi:hypothetical protein